MTRAQAASLLVLILGLHWLLQRRHALLLPLGFMYWGPLPAVLLIPLIALFGVHFSDIFFTLCVGAGNVALIALLLRRACQKGVISLAPAQRGLLVLFFAFGTVACARVSTLWRV
jgi:hypothetical protein